MPVVNFLAKSAKMTQANAHSVYILFIYLTHNFTLNLNVLSVQKLTYHTYFFNEPTFLYIYFGPFVKVDS